MIVSGCDVGAGAVKLVVMDDQPEQILFSHQERIRKRNPTDVVKASFERAAEAGFELEDFVYIASTGEGEPVTRRTGHFYSMTCHARGARFFCSDSMSALDIGALHMRAMKLDERGKVIDYKMTSQCASGTGQFLENIARYLGVTLEEIPALSLSATEPQAPSTICAVLAETDVVNLVSQGVSLPNIIRGIHDSVAERAVKLLDSFGVASPLVLTGGLGNDMGLVRAIADKLEGRGSKLDIVTDERSIYAGAIGAALWGGHRHRKLAGIELVDCPVASAAAC
jgi:benzoyl-CoA reductase subunit D